MSEPDVSIVVVSYNVRDLLAQCLESVIFPQPSMIGTGAPSKSKVPLEIETFVIDNASTDGSTAMVRERFPSVQLFENAENRGFAAANNQAFVAARGRYIWMLNPDTIVRRQALETLVGFMDRHPHAGACGGKLLYADGSLQHSAFGFPTLAQIFFDFYPLHPRLTDSRLNGRYPRKWYARGAPFQIDHPLGADLMIRREMAKQVGWLDDKFFIYCEEIDWCIRIKRADWQIWCVPLAEIVHLEAQSTRQFRDAMFVELWRARIRLFEKHYSRAFRWAAWQIVRAGLANEMRLARKNLVTQDELNRRLAAYKEVQSLMQQGSKA
jgi:N-acetylglucosaminyl-diphospho-decaprenol L-rhamnosyltransferase